MIKLINIELKKIFKHKSIYVVLLIIFLFCLLNNILYKVDYDNDGFYKYEDESNINSEIDDLKKELNNYNLDNENDINMYITIKTKLYVAQGRREYDKNTWQYIKYNDYLYQDLYNINYYTYVYKDDNLLKSNTDKYNDKLNKFKSNNWEYFVNIEKDNLESKITSLDNKLNNTKDKQVKEELEEESRLLNNELVIINYRLNNNINYGNSYLNEALLEYKENLDSINNYANKNLTYKEKIYYNDILSSLNINKYIIENKINVNKQNNLNYQLRSIADDYEVFIIIIVLIVTSVLISEEFNKGTIKLLLIKPFKRSKILFSKYITGVILIFLTITFIILCQILIGGILFGLDSLKLPVVVYDYNLSHIRTFNIFIYMLIRVLAKLPMFIMILTISVTLGILINSTIGTFSITILLYTFSEVINNIIVTYNIKLMQYFITMNWSFKDYLFGGLSNFRYITLKKSILIYLIYVIILLGVMAVSFRKKNIKNI